MNKEERRKYNTALTYHYLKEQDTADEAAQEIANRLDKAANKDDDVAYFPPVSGDDDCMETNAKMSSTRALSRTYVGQTWKQRAIIIFIFLHPKIGNRNMDLTCLLTRVKHPTLSGWLCQKRMMWVDIVEDMNASVAIMSPPSQIQEQFSHVDPESTVSVLRYRKRLPSENSNNLLVYFKGGKVRNKFFFSCISLTFHNFVVFSFTGEIKHS
jgi:hypothetical protein